MELAEMRVVRNYLKYLLPCAISKPIKGVGARDSQSILSVGVSSACDR